MHVTKGQHRSTALKSTVTVAPPLLQNLILCQHLALLWYMPLEAQQQHGERASARQGDSARRLMGAADAMLNCGTTPMEMASSSTPTARASNARRNPPLLACSSASAPAPSATAAAYAFAWHRKGCSQCLMLSVCSMPTRPPLSTSEPAPAATAAAYAFACQRRTACKHTTRAAGFAMSQHMLLQAAGRGSTRARGLAHTGRAHLQRQQRRVRALVRQAQAGQQLHTALGNGCDLWLSFNM